MNKFLLLLATVCGLLGVTAAYSQDRYPARPIRILCGFGVGGGTDVIARVIGPKMTETWGQGVVVDNRKQ